MADRKITIWAGDTEPLPLVNIADDNDTSLTNVTGTEMYLWDDADDSRYVTAATTISLTATAATATFDPAGAGPTGGDAFKVGDHGTYRGFLKLTWNDGDTTRHPNDHQLTIVVLENHGEA